MREEGNEKVPESADDLLFITLENFRKYHWNTTEGGHWYTEQLRYRALTYGENWAESRHTMLADRSGVSEFAKYAKHDHKRNEMELTNGVISVGPSDSEPSSGGVVPLDRIGDLISTRERDLKTGRRRQTFQLTFWRKLSREDVAEKLADMRKQSDGLIVSIKCYEIFEAAFRQFPDATEAGDACDLAGIDMESVVRLMDSNPS